MHKQSVNTAAASPKGAHVAPAAGKMMGKTGRRFSRRTVVGVASLVVCLATLIPVFAFAALPTPAYTWYTANPDAEEFTLSGENDFLGFAALVNGTADTDGDGDVDSSDVGAVSFAGKTIKLGNTLNLQNSEVQPIGTQATPFSGTFDGQGKTIDNYQVATTANTDVGLFGYTSDTSALENVVIGSGAALTLTRTAEQAVGVGNIGLLAGTCSGSISNCTVSGDVSVSHAMDQTADILFPIKNVGCLVGLCLGDVTACSSTSNASVNVSETGVLYIPPTAAEGETQEETQSVVVLNIGGLAGCVGDPDSTVDPDVSGVIGTTSSCENAASISIDTPSENGLDRFGNKAFVLSSSVGGIVGYSRGSVISCVNTGTIEGVHARDVGGIIGALRAPVDSSNFSEVGGDDGLRDGAEVLTVVDCRNTGSILGQAMAAGIVGRAGTNTCVTSCMNGVSTDGTLVRNYILGSRATKPFVAGIIGSTYGTVSYCANFGDVASALVSAPIDVESGRYTIGSGYYASGIAGIVQFYTDENKVRNQPMPEVYACFNAGPVIAANNMRQRALVGDNEGYVHDCVAVAGLVFNDELFYTEGAAGITGNCFVVTAEQLQGNLVFDTTTSATPLSVLNTNGDKFEWENYWTTSRNSVNSGYPVLDSQVDWPLTDLSTATVSLAANAQYTGSAAVPKATVTLGDVTLAQGVDFKVLAQADAIEVTPEGATPYTATVVGIGSYSGTAVQTFAYGIDRGDLVNCTVLIDGRSFNWEAQTPDASEIHVYNLAGAEVDADEYIFAFDATDTFLTDGQAINAKTYKTIITAKDDSEHFYGTNTTGKFTIKPVKIVWDPEEGDDATVEKITYNGVEYDWQSTSARIADADILQLGYTGHSIKPDVTKVTFLGRDLTLGVDYRVIYDGTMDGANPDPTPNTEVGDGWIIARYVAGGNFDNYDIMKFKIVDSGNHNIADATVPAIEPIIYEEGAPYEPVEVWYGGSKLTKGADYTIAYEGNDQIGTASYTILGMGIFSGSTKRGTFEIIEGTPYNLTYSLDSESGTAAITGVEYLGCRDDFDMVIPGIIEDGGETYTVTAIADKAFGGTNTLDFTGSLVNTSKTRIGSVTIPVSVTSIGEYAFGSADNANPMTQLASVVFENGSQLSSIGIGAFRTAGFSTIVIPASVESIAASVFREVPLETVTFLSNSADKPTINSGTVKNSFFGIEDLAVSGYESATGVKAYVTGRASDGWTWNSLGDGPAAFAVTFAAGEGATGDVPTMVDQVAGTSVLLPSAESLSKEGCAFVGWKCSLDDVVYQAASRYAMTAAPTSFIAQWSRVTPISSAVATTSEMVKNTYGDVGLEPVVTVKMGTSTLQKETHYELWYEGIDGTDYPASKFAPSEAGSYAVTVRGIGDYSGTLDAGTFMLVDPPVTPVGGTPYRVVSAASDTTNPFVLDVAGSSPVSGANVSIWTNNGGDNQCFTFEQEASGFYVLRNVANTSLVLDAAGSMPASGSNVSTWTLGVGKLNQRWVLLPAAGDGRFQVASAADTTLVLDAAGSTPAIGANVALYADHDGINQTWSLVAGNDVSVASVTTAGMVRNATGGPLAPDVTVKMGATALDPLDYCLRFTDTSTGEEVAGSPSEAGTYTVSVQGARTYTGEKEVGTFELVDPGVTIAVDTSYRIVSAASDSGNPFVLDVAGSSPVSGANVSIWVNNGGSNQCFTFEATGDGFYALRNVANPTLVLDAAGSAPVQGSNVSTWTLGVGKVNQRWVLLPANTPGQFQIASAANTDLVLDAAGSTPSIGANVSIWGNGHGLNQTWSLVAGNDVSGASLSATGMVRNATGTQLAPEVTVKMSATVLVEGTDYHLLYDGLPTAPFAVGDYTLTIEGIGECTGTKEVGTFRICEPPEIDAEASYHLVSSASPATTPYVLDVAGRNPVSGANVSVYRDNGGENQCFIIEADMRDGTPTGYYLLRNKANRGLVLDAAGAVPAIGANVSTFAQNAGLNQRWVFIPTGVAGEYQIASAANTAFVLDAAGSTPVQGANVSIWTVNTPGLNQKWTLQETTIASVSMSETSFVEEQSEQSGIVADNDSFSSPDPLSEQDAAIVPEQNMDSSEPSTSSDLGGGMVVLE